jgi:hypothetical protein
VAICYSSGSALLLYCGAAVLCVLGVLASFAGSDPATTSPEALAEAAI